MAKKLGMIAGGTGVCHLEGPFVPPFLIVAMKTLNGPSGDVVVVAKLLARGIPAMPKLLGNIAISRSKPGRKTAMNPAKLSSH